MEKGKAESAFTLEKYRPDRLREQPHSGSGEAEILYAGFWTDKGNADSGIPSLFKELGKTDNMPPEIILFGTAGFGADQAYYDWIIQAAACELPESVKLKASIYVSGKNAAGCAGTIQEYDGSQIRRTDGQSLWWITTMRL